MKCSFCMSRKFKVSCTIPISIEYDDRDRIIKYIAGKQKKILKDTHVCANCGRAIRDSKLIKENSGGNLF